MPPGYRRTKPPVKPKLDAFIPVIDRILADDKLRPKKQQHTAKRIFERLRDEHGFTGGITIVKDYVAGWRQRSQEMFVPLVHPPGHAQADFGDPTGALTVTVDSASAGFTVGTITFTINSANSNTINTGTTGSKLLIDNGVEISAEPIDQGNSPLSTLLFGFGPALLIILFYVWMFRRAAKQGGGLGAGG